MIFFSFCLSVFSFFLHGVTRREGQAVLWESWVRTCGTCYPEELEIAGSTHG